MSAGQMVAIASVAEVTVGMSVRPKGARLDYVVTQISERGFVYYRRLSNGGDVVIGSKSPAAIAKGELRRRAV